MEVLKSFGSWANLPAVSRTKTDEKSVARCRVSLEEVSENARNWFVSVRRGFSYIRSCRRF